jgi:hypothetical protein
MPVMAGPNPMPSPVVGVTPGIAKHLHPPKPGIRGVMEKANMATKDGPLHDQADDAGGPDTVKECPECGETYTGALESHVHKTGGGQMAKAVTVKNRGSREYARDFRKALRTTIRDFMKGPLGERVAEQRIHNSVKPIGFMVPKESPGSGMPSSGGHNVFCSSCSPRVGHRTPVFRENIGNYRQSCHGCGRQLVEGKMGWPELFSKS